MARMRVFHEAWQPESRGTRFAVGDEAAARPVVAGTGRTTEPRERR
ncbi:hypothetical protein [Streptomyces sp. NPDC096012]